MNLTQFFYYKNRKIRTFYRKGNTWLFYEDVCRAFEIEDCNKAYQSLEFSEKMELQLLSFSKSYNIPLINESGFYALYLISKEGERFRFWLTSEVIPSIRKSGKYALKEGNQKAHSHIQIFKKFEKEDTENIRNIK